MLYTGNAKIFRLVLLLGYGQPGGLLRTACKTVFWEERRSMLGDGQMMISAFRLLIALAAGGILGLERSRKGIEAGFRTHILVCTSSCAIMITNIYLFSRYHAGDLTRMPAQVISGVGFLGAGCILVTRQNRIKGMTTAACLWASACLGLCIGAGEYFVAVFVLILAFLSMTFLHWLEDKVNQRTKNIRFYAEFRSSSDLTGFMKAMQRQGIVISDIECLKSNVSDDIGTVISLHLKTPVSAELFLSELSSQEYGPVYLTKL